ncbi:hypothetical protein ACWCPD_25625 [Streptomyces sp. NPDC001935]
MKLAEVFDILRRVEPQEDRGREFWLSSLPDWLVEEFAPEFSEVEQRAWLGRWRKASLRERARLVDERGWEVLQWTYWFGDENEEWVLSSVEADPVNDVLRIFLGGAGEESPIAAVKWIVERSGCHVIASREISE